MATQAEPVFSSTEALRYGWSTMRANLRPLVILGAIGALLVLVERSLPSEGALLLKLALQLLEIAFAVVLIRTSLRLHDGQPIALSDDRVDEVFRDFWGYLLTSLLLGLIVAGGLLLLIVPGVLWALRYGFAGFCAIDAHSDPLAALRESRRITEGARGALLGFGLLVFGVNLLGALALGVGTIVTVPTTCLAAAYVFRRLEAHAGPRTAEPPRPVSLTPAQAT